MKTPTSNLTQLVIVAPAIGQTSTRKRAAAQIITRKILKVRRLVRQPGAPWSQLAFLSTTLAWGLLATVPAPANATSCSGSSSITCSISAGSYTSNQAASYSGTDGTSSSKTGGTSPDVALTNDGSFAIGYSYSDIEGGTAILVDSVGGFGYDEGNGGSAGSVTVTNNGTLGAVLNGTGSGFFPTTSLLYVLSEGGGGSQDNKNNDSNGGSGGTGGTVSVQNNAALTLSGTVTPYGFYGIRAESTGGFGGEQNNTVSGLGDQFGGPGGNASATTVTNQGSISFGSSSARIQGPASGVGILAQAAGGGGGNYNGSAGAGNAAGITNTGAISIYWNTTSVGIGVFGLLGVSKGGEGIESTDNSDRGGNGGTAEYATVSSSNAGILLDVTGIAGVVGAAMAAESRGGNGGEGPGSNEYGGTGGTSWGAQAHLTNNGSLTTHGDSMFGILAESLGGQGGDARNGGALAGTGGGGGFGGNAGSITVTTDPTTAIITTGDYATGIVGHSVGGGGGTGADFVGVLGGSGGNGGNGGDAGEVSIETAGRITTSGDHAYGILAQSVGGSGGNGGVDTSVLLALGGSGAGGGTASTARVANGGSITTSGYTSMGIIAQSIGGGGGAAGSASGDLAVGGDSAGTTTADGGLAQIDNTGFVTTTGAAAIGLLAQSVGGGGGSGGDAKGIAGVGGTGSGGGAGGTVNLFDLGTIKTSGDFASGALAQSIGGGGGNGGDTMTISVGVSLGIGGSASGGGNGGTVCADNTGGCASSLPAILPSNITTLGDYANGVIAQSVGGGGGTGGSANNKSLLSFVELQIGGSAGAGGTGGNVTVRQDFLSVATSGEHATGVLAQSIGGGGGNGGDASYFDATVGFNAGVAIGGSGGVGGPAQSTTVDLRSSSIITGMPPANVDPSTFAPDDSIGILAQSIGGGGGNGGSSSAKDFVLAAPTGTGVPVALNFQASVGGNGGSAGTGGTVNVSLSNGTSVATLGDGSHAVVAQSIGGGGGNGGDASALSTTLGDGDTVEIGATIAIGGVNTGSGSNGGQVNVTLGDTGSSYVGLPPALQLPPVTTYPPASTIVTYGDYADGVLAQSIGGGGGNGGVGASNAYAQGGLVNLKATVGLGGAGGQGGAGGIVNLTQNPNQTIQTLGSGSRGLVAQSIGGGGGNSQGGTMYLGGAISGYGARLTVSVGKTGGSGGNGNTVNATTNGAISTVGDDADGVMLQSIGGGGGLGGSIGADASSNPILDRIATAEDNKNRLSDSGATYTFTVNVGGSGGGGGDGGAINISHDGKIATLGDWADGYVAQSIGGGGGAGGSSTASGSKVNANITVGVGGSGGVAGNGGQITASFIDNHSNSINTAGYGAYGVLLQSIGGGGGQGGDGSDQASGNLTVGGIAGGSGGASGNGGTISIPAGGSWINLGTVGDDAPGLVMQSIGGGGGTGGAGNANAAQGVATHQIAVSVGGQGGVSGNGGNIDVSTGGSFATHGARSYAVVAQSIGGGGGIAGAGSADNLVSVSLGGNSGANGNGGTVALALTSGTNINTSGAGAHAIVAQSIGGGGGIAGDTAKAIQLDPNAWGGTPTGSAGVGNGTSVTVSVNGSVITSGANAFGIIAQSIGNGGGLGGDGGNGFAGTSHTSASTNSAGGTVTVTQAGSITVNGAGSSGIFAQSQGLLDDSIVTVNVNGTVQGGTGTNGNGVWVAAGKNNVLNIGATGQISALSSNAVRYVGDSTTSYGSLLTVNNSGVINGNVLCANTDSGSACQVYNVAGGILTGAEIYEANVDNAALMVLGSPGTFSDVSVTGNFSQQASGVIRATADFDRLRSDRLIVQGTSNLAGAIDVEAVSLLPNREVTVVTALGPTQGQLGAISSPVINYQTRQDGQDYRVRAASADFAASPMGLKRNQAEVADNLQRAWDLGGNSALGPLFAALDQASRQGAGTYQQRMSDLSPGVALAPAVQMQASTARFNGAMMSCPTFTGTDALTGERNCIWGQVTGRSTNQDGNGGTADLHYDSTTYQFGGQRQFSPGWFIGASGAYQNSQLRGQDSRVSGDGDSGFLGVVLKHEAGPWTFSGALGGGYGSYDLDRNIGIPGLQSTAKGSPDVYSTGVKLRAARTFTPTNNFYLKPYVDLDASYARMPGYNESGNALHLSVDSSDQFVMGLSPVLEIGGRADLGNGATMRPYAYAGASFLSKDKWSTDAHLQGAPAGTGSFTTTMATDKVMAKIGAGLQVSTASGMDFRLQYDGELSSKVSSHSGTLRVMVPF